MQVLYQSFASPDIYIIKIEKNLEKSIDLNSAPLIILLLIIVKFVALFGSFGSIKRKK